MKSVLRAVPRRRLLSVQRSGGPPALSLRPCVGLLTPLALAGSSAVGQQSRLLASAGTGGGGGRRGRANKKRSLPSSEDGGGDGQVSLRKLVGSLYLRVHPDFLQSHGEQVQSTNERSLQELNAFIDVAESCCNGRFEKAHSHLEDEYKLKFYFLATGDAAKGTGAEESDLLLTEVAVKVPRATFKQTKSFGSLSRERRAVLQEQWKSFTESVLRKLVGRMNIPVPKDGFIVQRADDALRAGAPTLDEKLKAFWGRASEATMLRDAILRSETTYQDTAALKHGDDIQLSTARVSMIRRFLSTVFFPRSVRFHELSETERDVSYQQLFGLLSEHSDILRLRSEEWKRVRIVMSRARAEYSQVWDPSGTLWLFLPPRIDDATALHHIKSAVFART